MADERRTPEDLLGAMREVRSRNNDLWMGLAGLAVLCAPEQAREIIRGIRQHDKMIVSLWDEMLDAPDRAD